MKNIFSNIKKATSKTDKTKIIIYLILRVLVILCLIR